MDFIKGRQPKRRRSALKAVSSQIFKSPDPARRKRVRSSPLESPLAFMGRKGPLFPNDSPNDEVRLQSSKVRRRSLTKEDSSVSQSQLFNPLDEAGTALSLETATLLPSQETNDAFLTNSCVSPQKGRLPAKENQSSLFGAVMNSVQRNKPSTPTSNVVGASPGGFKLMNFVNSVTSPFQSMFHRGGAAPSTPHQSQSPASPEGTPRHEREWHQAEVSPIGDVCLIDWVLKSKLEFECIPGHSLHLDSTSIQHKARRRFMTRLSTVQSTKSRVIESIDDAAVRWHEGLLFWQYPSSKKDASQEGKLPSLSKPKPSLKNRVLMRSSSLPAPFAEVGKQTGSGKALSPREIEWKEAFQSLFDSWIVRMDDLSALICDESIDELSTQISEFYFYSQSDSHTILFRFGLVGENNHSGNMAITPEIVVSSTNRAQRERLQNEGIRWRVLKKYEKSDNHFSEDLLSNKVSKPVDSDALRKSPSNFDDDLAALRRSQIFGQSIGADVSISQMPRSRKQTTPTRMLSPLFVCGRQDCVKFSQIYRETIGSMCHVTADDIKGRAPHLERAPVVVVPLLLCRGLGPFMHSSLKSLACDFYHMSSASVQSSKEQNESSFDGLEATGIILPCAVRALMGAVIASVQTTQHKSREKDNTDDNAESVEDANHVIVSFSRHENVGRHPDRKKHGIPCTSYFNTEVCLWNKVENSYSYQHCHFAEVVETAVWDSNRPNDIAYKLDRLL